MRLKVLLGIVLALLIASPIAVAQELLPPDDDEEKEEAPAAPEGEKLTQAAEIEKLIGELNSDEWSVRENATKRLIEIGTPAAKAVEKLADSDSTELRLRAHKVLEALHYVTKADREKIEKEIELCLGGSAKPVDEETKKLIGDLSSEEWQTREDATKKLIEKGLPVLPEITKLLKSDDPEVKTRAEVIVKGIEENAKKKLAEQLVKSVAVVKGITCAPYYLIETLTVKKEKRREHVVTGMLMGTVELKGTEDTGGIINLGAGGKRAMTRTVIIQGGKRRVFVNGEEVTPLGKNPTADRVLVAIVADDKKDMDLRLKSLDALKERKAECAVGELMKILTKSSGKLQLETAGALRKITGQEFGPTGQSTLEEAEKALEEWKKWWEENKKEQKYKFVEQPGDDSDSLDEVMKQFKKALGNDKETKKKIDEIIKRAQGVLGEEKKKEEEKKEEPKKEEKPAEPEKKEEKPSEPEKKGEGGEDKSGDF